jgi:hypothetical protein
MRPLLVCLTASFILTLVVAGWLLFVPAGSDVAFVLLFPALWLTSSTVGPNLGTSDSGPTNFIVLVLASSVLNVALYATVFFLLFKVWRLVHRRKLETKS